ncbi:lysylphosphatidylglycerol synthase transmembrane domain-containing protein [Kitasatospora sp. NPDC096077]|uniref:lysylphosphatidylglycerol synthase transmembrane domain-containing protein n=1 Tax=Kitasatospora sp. NPDC096077 TaxID=3155544 RepID=UPI003323DA64
MVGIALRVVNLAMVIGAVWWFVRGVDLKALGQALEQASPSLLLVAVLLNLVSQYISAQGWRIMLGPRHPVPLGRLLRYEFSAQAASAIVPGRVGELIRLWFLKQDGVPASTTGGLIWLEKLFGAVGLAVLVAPVPWLLADVPGVITGCIAVFAAVMAVQLGLLIVLTHRDRPEKLPKFLRGFIGGMYFLREPRPVVTMLALMLLGEAADVAGAVAVLHALGIHLPLTAAVLTLFLIDLSNLLPIAPGHFGTFEVGALYALNLGHVQPSLALAFALLFHLQQNLPQVAVGLPLELPLIVGRRRLRRVGDPTTESAIESGTETAEQGMAGH